MKWLFHHAPFVALGRMDTSLDSSYMFSRMIWHTARLQKAAEVLKYIAFNTKAGKAAVKKERLLRGTLHFISAGVKLYTANK